MTITAELNSEQIEKANKIHFGSIVVDGLSYLSIPPKEDSYLKTMIESGVTATNFTVPYPSMSPWDTIKLIAEWYGSLNQFSDRLILATKVEDIEKAKQEGKTCLIIGFQEPRPFNEDLNMVDVFHKIGLRVTTLTYQYRNAVGGACAQQANDAGLTPFGRDLIQKMNDVGILIDLSHVGPKTSMQAVELSNKPVVASHSGLLGLKKHVRNISDELVQAIAESGGLVGLPSYTQFLGYRDPRKGTIEDFLDNIDYIVNLTGPEHVGIGLDLCPSWNAKDYEKCQREFPEIYLDIPYEDANLKGLKSITNFIDITRGLVGRGYSDEDIQNILGGNYMRIFKEVW